MEPCLTCGRLVFVQDPSCPHCQAGRQPLVLSATCAVALFLAGCGESTAIYGVPTSEDEGESGCMQSSETDGETDTQTAGASDDCDPDGDTSSGDTGS